jgi:hypothetical protein
MGDPAVAGLDVPGLPVDGRDAGESDAPEIGFAVSNTRK